MPNALAQLLDRHAVVLLDGATGTELQRRGVDTPLPLWTADAALQTPDVLRQIHIDYLRAGAHIITANTFRTTPYSLRASGRESQAHELTRRTVEIAREACANVGHGVVAGSISPLEDCFHPERVPAQEILLREHAVHAQNLAQAGVDLLLVETMNCVREAHDAARVALETGLPVLVSLILDPQGAGNLLSGEDLDVAWSRLRPLPVAGFLVNCTPAHVVTRALERMQWSAEVRPLGAYANFGVPDEQSGWKPDTRTPPEEYARIIEDWRERGARLIGGCCGTTPDHIRAIARHL